MDVAGRVVVLCILYIHYTQNIDFETFRWIMDLLKDKKMLFINLIEHKVLLKIAPLFDLIDVM